LEEFRNLNNIFEDQLNVLEGLTFNFYAFLLIAISIFQYIDFDGEVQDNVKNLDFSIIIFYFIPSFIRVFG
jgi:hypothetical protein